MGTVKTRLLTYSMCLCDNVFWFALYHFSQVVESAVAKSFSCFSICKPQVVSVCLQWWGFDRLGLTLSIYFVWFVSFSCFWKEEHLFFLFWFENKNSKIFCLFLFCSPHFRFDSLFVFTPSLFEKLLLFVKILSILSCRVFFV